MSGFWSGEFGYASFKARTTPFLANLLDDGGKLTGTTTEPDRRSTSGGLLRAIIRGTRSGLSVEFVKAYDGAGRLAHSVEYQGEIAEDGLSVRGHWYLERHWGTFQMSRQAVNDSEVELEKREALEVADQPSD